MSIQPRPIQKQTECKFPHLNRSTNCSLVGSTHVGQMYLSESSKKKTPDDNYDPNMAKSMETMPIDSGSHMTINHNANLSAMRPQSHKSAATVREN